MHLKIYASRIRSSNYMYIKCTRGEEGGIIFNDFKNVALFTSQVAKIRRSDGGSVCVCVCVCVWCKGAWVLNGKYLYSAIELYILLSICY